MASLTLRTVKGVPLTNGEVDANFTNINNEVVSILGVVNPGTGLFTGNLTGNAGTASALQTSRRITVVGDAAGSVDFDGSSDVVLDLTVSQTTADITRDSIVVNTPGNTFAVAGGYDVAFDAIEIYLNGVLLSETDYALPDGTNVVLDTAAAVGDEITAVITKSLVLINSVGQATSVAEDNSTNANHFLGFYEQPSGPNNFKASSNLSYNPSTNTLNSGDFNSTSDITLKTNIHTAPGLHTIRQLRGVEFEWKSDGRKSAGVIAQEIEKVIPHAVSDNGANKTVAYNQIIAYLIQGMQEQMDTIECLEDRITRLENNNV